MNSSPWCHCVPRSLPRCRMRTHGRFSNRRSEPCPPPPCPVCSQVGPRSGFGHEGGQGGEAGVLSRALEASDVSEGDQGRVSKEHSWGLHLAGDGVTHHPGPCGLGVDGGWFLKHVWFCRQAAKSFPAEAAHPAGDVTWQRASSRRYKAQGRQGSWHHGSPGGTDVEREVAGR